MNIGFDAKRFFHNFTGLGNYSRFIVQALVQEFPSNHYYLFTPHIHAHPEINSLATNSSITTILPPGWLTSIKGGSFWRSCLLGNEASKNNVELFHGLSGELPFGLKGMKSVVTIHDLIFYRFPQYYNPLDVAIYKAKVKYAASVASRIIAISEQTAQDIIHFLKIPAHKIRVVYQGCHPNFKRAISPDELSMIKRKYQLPDNFILSVGTIEERKNVLLILQALTRFKPGIDNSLVIVGRPTKYISILKQFISDHKLEKRVTFLHDVKFEELPGIYRLSSVFVYPSLFEGFGIPLVEAITCCLPVISSTGSCFTEAAGPFSLFVDPHDADALAEALEKVITQPSLRQEMINRSLQYIERFEPNQIAKDLMKVYNEVE